MNAYTLRDIPADLHHAWKSAAAMRGETMRDYCFRALLKTIRHDLLDSKKEVREDVSGPKQNVNR